jgi:hypothetical protein
MPSRSSVVSRTTATRDRAVVDANGGAFTHASGTSRSVSTHASHLARRGLEARLSMSGDSPTGVDRSSLAPAMAINPNKPEVREDLWCVLAAPQVE